MPDITSNQIGHKLFGSCGNTFSSLNTNYIARENLAILVNLCCKVCKHLKDPLYLADIPFVSCSIIRKTVVKSRTVEYS